MTKIGEFVKSQKTPSPLKGEGWGEGEEIGISTTYSPLPLIPSHEGRGKKTFYKTVKIVLPMIFKERSKDEGRSVRTVNERRRRRAL